jgi:hypothetical protein
MSDGCLSPTLQLRILETVLRRFSYRYSDEVQLHTAIAQVLTSENLEFAREHRLDAKSRADFWMAGVLIEVKVDGSLSEALRQVDRYCVYRAVTGVLLATTLRWGDQPLKNKATLRGKPFAMVRLRRQSL